ALSLQTELMERVLKAKGIEDPEIGGLAADMRRVMSNLIELLTDTLDLSQFETGQVEDRPITFVLDEWMETTLAPYEATAIAKDIDFTWRVDNEGRLLRGDRGKLSRVLGNLVGNAVKFTQSGEVDVRAEAGDDGGFVLTVKDTGPGIPADQFD